MPRLRVFPVPVHKIPSSFQPFIWPSSGELWASLEFSVSPLYFQRPAATGLSDLPACRSTGDSFPGSRAFINYAIHPRETSPHNLLYWRLGGHQRWAEHGFD